MIQRIQTIFLLLAAISLGLLFWQPTMSFFLVNPKPTTEMNMLSDGIFDISDHIIFLILTGLGAGLCFIGIFLFKNRSLQANFARFGFIISILILILGALFFYKEWDAINSSVDTHFSGEFGLLSPIVAALFSFLALRFIRKDENLVKSSDRLR